LGKKTPLAHGKKDVRRGETTKKRLLEKGVFEKKRLLIPKNP